MANPNAKNINDNKKQQIIQILTMIVVFVFRFKMDDPSMAYGMLDTKYKIGSSTNDPTRNPAGNNVASITSFIFLSSQNIVVGWSIIVFAISM